VYRATARALDAQVRSTTKAGGKIKCAATEVARGAKTNPRAASAVADVIDGPRLRCSRDQATTAWRDPRAYVGTLRAITAKKAGFKSLGKHGPTPPVTGRLLVTCRGLARGSKWT